MENCKHEIIYRYEKKYARTKCAACNKVVKPAQGYPLPEDYQRLSSWTMEGTLLSTIPTPKPKITAVNAGKGGLFGGSLFIPWLIMASGD